MIEQKFFYDKYPHLFKRLSWWEEREESEMPEYVKNAADGIVFKVEYNFRSKTPSDVKTWNNNWRMFWHSLYDLLPATETEYLSHKNQPA